MLVEDNEADAELVRAAIEDTDRDVDVEWFQRGDRALERLRGSDLPHLVLLDLNLPGRSGQEVLEILRSEPRTAPLPVIIMSSSSVRSEVEQCYRLGANCYIQTPLDYHRLVEVMREIGPFWLDTALVHSAMQR